MTWSMTEASCRTWTWESTHFCPPVKEVRVVQCEERDDRNQVSEEALALVRWDATNGSGNVER